MNFVSKCVEKIRLDPLTDKSFERVINNLANMKIHKSS